MQPPAGSHLCAVHVSASGKDMSRNGVNQVEKPDEGQTEQQGLGKAPGPVTAHRGGSHAPQRLEVERTEEERGPHIHRPQPHPEAHEDLTPLFGRVQLSKKRGRCVLANVLTYPLQEVSSPY